MTSSEFSLDQEDFPLFYEPVVLLLGTFDGVHLGHQALLKAAKEEAINNNSNVVVLTFKTPPAWFFSPDNKMPLIMTLEERIKWLKAYGADHVLFMDFTKDVASLTALEFLTDLNKRVPIIKLFLGHDGRIGSDKGNNREIVLEAAKQLGFNVQYLPSYQVEGETVSSTLIRTLLENEDFEGAKKLLGHEL